MSNPTNDNITLSSNAVQRILALIEQEQKPILLRITVNGGGCSGFEYNFTLGTARKPDDHVFTNHGATIVVDGVSLGFIKGSEVDYVEDLVGSSFVINNPQAVSACGCGNSFAI